MRARPGWIAGASAKRGSRGSGCGRNIRVEAAAPGREAEEAAVDYGSENRFGACPPPNWLGKFGATTQAAMPTRFSSVSPPVGLQSKLGKIPDCADCRPLSDSGCG